MLRLRTLGTLRLEGPHGVLLAGKRKELALLAYLARRAPAAVPRAELAELLWGDREEARARHSLRQALLALKRALGDVLVVAGDGVAVAAGAVELDAAAFQGELEAGRVEAALAWWGGGFMGPHDDLGSGAYRVWVDGERARLRRLLEAALERWVTDAEARAEWPVMAERAARWAELDPHAVRPCALRVEALLLDGRTELARAEHAAFGARLAAAGEGEPPAEWVRLAERIGRGGGGRPQAPA
ncbi:MAG: hypothetical protein AVDCRST_MAG68-4652, partial [uncultured Gemmatimonadetes bacterium]